MFFIREFARHIYKGQRWKKVRQYIFEKYYGLCAECGAPGEEVHHKTFLTPQNVNDPEIVYGENNLVLLCKECHFKKHRKTNPLEQTFKRRRLTNNGCWFDESGNVQPVRRWIICGAPASGKSTYVQEHMLPGDLVVDLDLIGQAIGMSTKAALPYNLLPTAYDIRDYLYKLIESDKVDARNIWIIAALPDSKSRTELAGRLRAEIVDMKADINTCIERALCDPERMDKELQKQIIEDYFAKYGK